MLAILKNRNRLAINCMVFLLLAPVQIHTHRIEKKIYMNHTVQDGVLPKGAGGGQNIPSGPSSLSDITMQSSGESANCGKTALGCSLGQSSCLTAGDGAEDIKDCMLVDNITGECF